MGKGLERVAVADQGLEVGARVGHLLALLGLLLLLLVLFLVLGLGLPLGLLGRVSRGALGLLLLHLLHLGQCLVPLLALALLVQHRVQRVEDGERVGPVQRLAERLREQENLVEKVGGRRGLTSKDASLLSSTR